MQVQLQIDPLMVVAYAPQLSVSLTDTRPVFEAPVDYTTARYDITLDGNNEPVFTPTASKISADADFATMMTNATSAQGVRLMSLTPQQTQSLMGIQALRTGIAKRDTMKVIDDIASLFK